jgi:hypothetical protein
MIHICNGQLTYTTTQRPKEGDSNSIPSFGLIHIPVSNFYVEAGFQYTNVLCSKIEASEKGTSVSNTHVTKSSHLHAMPNDHFSTRYVREVYFLNYTKKMKKL